MYHLKKCAHCTARKESAAEIYLQHVTAVARLAREMAARQADRSVPLEAAIIWDDMLREMPAPLIQSARAFLLTPLQQCFSCVSLFHCIPCFTVLSRMCALYCTVL